jgi:hypothetical protein
MDDRDMYFPTKYSLFRQNTHSSAHSSGKKDLVADDLGKNGSRPKFPGFRQTVKSPKIFSYITDRIITLCGHTWTDKTCIFSPLFRQFTHSSGKNRFFRMTSQDSFKPDMASGLSSTTHSSGLYPLFRSGTHSSVLKPTLQTKPHPLFRSNTHSSAQKSPTLQPEGTLSWNSSHPSPTLQASFTQTDKSRHPSLTLQGATDLKSGCAPEEWVMDKNLKIPHGVRPEEWVRT